MRFSRISSGVVPAEARYSPQVSWSSSEYDARRFSMLVVISSSAISTPFTVAATPPVRPDADSLDEHAAMPHMQAAASPAAQAALMIRAVFI